MSLDSLTNIRLKLCQMNSPPRDEFAAYRLTETDQNEPELDHNSDHSTSSSTKSKSTSTKQTNADQANKSSANSSPSNAQPKKTRHHHHRAKRNNRNKNKNNSDMKKSQSNLGPDALLQLENEDSLSAFDFSNTDEFWEDDIVINSELIEADKFMSDEIESPTIKFVSQSCDSLNEILLLDGDKFELKESEIKDKLYDDIFEFKDNLTINWTIYMYKNNNTMNNMKILFEFFIHFYSGFFLFFYRFN